MKIPTQFQQAFRYTGNAIPGTDLDGAFIIGVGVVRTQCQEVVFKRRLGIGKGREPVETLHGTGHHGLKPPAQGVVHVGKQARGTPRSLENNIVLIVGMEKPELVIDIRQHAAHAKLDTLGDHIIQGRIRQEGIGQPAFKLDIVRVFTGCHGKFLRQGKHAFVARQLDGRRYPVGFAVGGIHVQVIINVISHAQ